MSKDKKYIAVVFKEKDQHALNIKHLYNSQEKKQNIINRTIFTQL